MRPAMKPEANDQSYFGVAFTAGTATDASSAVRRRRRRRGGAWIAVIVRPPRRGERFGHYGQSHSGIPRGLAKSVAGNPVLAAGAVSPSTRDPRIKCPQ